MKFRRYLLILLAASDKLIKLWNAYTGAFMRTLTGHTEGVSDIAWSPDTAFLASASDDKTVRIWDVDTVSVPSLLHKDWVYK